MILSGVEQQGIEDGRGRLDAGRMMELFGVMFDGGDHIACSVGDAHAHCHKYKRLASRLCTIILSAPRCISLSFFFDDPTDKANTLTQPWWNGGSFRAQGRRSQHGAGSLATGCTPITGRGHGRDYYTHYFRGYRVHQHLLVLLQRRSSQEGGGGEPAEGPSCLGGGIRRRDRGSGPSSSSLISEVQVGIFAYSVLRTISSGDKSDYVIQASQEHKAFFLNELMWIVSSEPRLDICDSTLV
ncbi:uncharacterized protein [Lolium perenne]|uniref:uncharacterized protein n=1 Tax=Lolium perenne TaxID=4522 RepID=UPI0021F55531|nr:uncharacterized protein LOC127340428 [Lolium perenne]